MNRIVSFFSCMILFCLALSVFAQEDSDEPGVGVETGELNKHDKHLNRLFPLKLDDEGRFQMDQNVWQACQLTNLQRNRRLRKITNKKEINPYLPSDQDSGLYDIMFGLTNGVMRTKARERIPEYYFETEDFRVSYRWNERAQNGNGEPVAFVGKVVEKTGPRRTLEIQDDLQGTFSLMLRGSDYFVMLDQEPGRPITLVSALGDEMFKLKEQSFFQFRKKHPSYSKHLFQIFASAGVDPPLFKDEQRVSAAARYCLMLQHREEAVSDSVFDDVGDADAKDEGKKVDAAETGTKENVREPGTDFRANEYLEEHFLLYSAEYAATLIREASPEELKVIYKHLDDLTGQEFNEDMKLLQAYLKNEHEKKTGDVGK